MSSMFRLWSSCIAGTLVLAACSGPAPQDEANDATAASTNTVDAANVAEPAADNASNAANAADAAPNAANAANAAVPEPAKTPEPTPTPKASATPAAAATPVAKVERPPQFAMCMTCHTVDQGGGGKLGPNLFGVVGSKAGSKAGFAYSDAMKNAGITWTRAELDAFLLAPQSKVPGTKMMMKGPSDEKARQAIIDYLASLK